jgi:S1-C subfamily serine protease
MRSTRLSDHSPARSTPALSTLARSWARTSAAPLIGALALSLAATMAAPPARAADPPAQALPEEATPAAIESVLHSVVRVRSYVPPEADSAKRLGSEREGQGIVVGDGGLIVTVSYLITEAMSVEIVDEQGRTRSASVVGFSNETGLGILRAPAMAERTPVPLGDSGALKTGTAAIVAGAGGLANAIPAVVVSRRPFAGSWEYLLEQAIYTAPAHSDWGGAALVSSQGKLLGVGSLLTDQARRDGEKMTGNVFIPVDLLRPMLDEVAATGRITPQPHPWLGLNAREHPGGLMVGRLSAHSPADAAGIRRGDLVTAVSGRPVDDLADFYRRVWAIGAPGVDVPLTVMRDGRSFTVKVRSASRYQFLAKERTY